MRAALNDLAGDLGGWLARVVTSFHCPAARIFRNAARLGRISLMLAGPPIGGPFPNVADHVVDAIAIRRKRRHRRGAIETVIAQIFVRKISLPGVGYVPTTGPEFVAPGKLGTVEPTARGVFPFGFGWQLLAHPFSVSQRIGVRHMHDRMVVQRIDIALRPVGMTPIRVLQIPPPLAEVFQIDGMARRSEHQRAGVQHVWQCAGIAFRIGRNFREGLVAGSADEPLELSVRHRRSVDPEAADGDAMDRRLFRVVLI